MTYNQRLRDLGIITHHYYKPLPQVPRVSPLGHTVQMPTRWDPDHVTRSTLTYNGTTIERPSLNCLAEVVYHTFGLIL